MKLATKQAVKQKFAQSVAFMQQTRNLPLPFLYGHSIVPYRLGLIFLLVVGLCSCGSLTSSGLNGTNFKIGTNVTPIREIKPEKDNKATVYIQGKVEKKAPLMKQWAYQISDSTGQIWVVTNQKNLDEGAQVVIKGKIRYRSIPLAGKELGEVYLEE
ncbi:OB-fold nucleic acid binding domain-containing protein [uncultured Nostoc sp.]|uniref:OB-fold nucleic acid binding domain-containing protein n=1 Tax=uncultured Nostoc sp. TaxID=340711 RepID=UPI0035CC0BD1